MRMTGFDEFSPLIGIIFAFLTIEFSEIEAIDLRIGSSNIKLVSISSKSNRCDSTCLLGFAISPWPVKMSEKCNANYIWTKIKTIWNISMYLRINIFTCNYTNLFFSKQIFPFLFLLSFSTLLKNWTRATSPSPDPTNNCPDLIRERQVTPLLNFSFSGPRNWKNLVFMFTPMISPVVVPQKKNGSWKLSAI